MESPRFNEEVKPDEDQAPIASDNATQAEVSPGFWCHNLLARPSAAVSPALNSTATIDKPLPARALERRPLSIECVTAIGEALLQSGHKGTIVAMMQSSKELYEAVGPLLYRSLPMHRKNIRLLTMGLDQKSREGIEGISVPKKKAANGISASVSRRPPYRWNPERHERKAFLLSHVQHAQLEYHWSRFRTGAKTNQRVMEWLVRHVSSPGALFRGIRHIQIEPLGHHLKWTAKIGHATGREICIGARHFESGILAVMRPILDHWISGSSTTIHFHHHSDMLSLSGLRFSASLAHVKVIHHARALRVVRSPFTVPEAAIGSCTDALYWYGEKIKASIAAKQGVDTHPPGGNPREIEIVNLGTGSPPGYVKPELHLFQPEWMSSDDSSPRYWDWDDTKPLYLDHDPAKDRKLVSDLVEMWTAEGWREQSGSTISEAASVVQSDSTQAVGCSRSDKLDEVVAESDYTVLWL